MGISTKIQWCDSTCNPTMGCDGCELWDAKTGDFSCYAGTLHRRYGATAKGFSPTFDQVTLWPGRMEIASKWADLTGCVRPVKPWLDGMPRLIFVSDMSDALSSGVDFDFLFREVFENVTSDNGARHKWLWLTKRPDRMASFSVYMRQRGLEWPENLWAGTSITNQKSVRRLSGLSRVGNDRTVRFVSLEPQRERVNLQGALGGVGWLIQGGESGTSSHSFEMGWISETLDACREQNVAYFLKQLGSHVVVAGVRGPGRT